MQPEYVEIITLSPGNEEEPLMKRHTICGSSWRSLQKFLRSPSLLKGFAWVFGLWRPRRQLRALAILFALIFSILPGCYLIVLHVIYIFVCPSEKSTEDNWYCGNDTRNISTTEMIVSLPFHINKKEMMLIVLSLTKFLPILPFFWSVWVLPTKENTVDQQQTCSLVQPTGWIKLNCGMLVSFCALIAINVWGMLDRQAYLLLSLISPFTDIRLQLVSDALQILAGLVACWIFGALTSSLETLISRCLDDITSSEHLDDIIQLHQKLCKVIFATSDVFKYWFMIHLALFTLTCMVALADFLLYIKIFRLSQSAFLICMNAMYSCLYMYIFIYPCYCAASVTGKCQQMLDDVNMKDKEEWHESHPFRRRKKLHLFLKYAEYANCGYKVGNLRFGSMAVFFSTLLAVIGAGLSTLSF